MFKLKVGFPRIKGVGEDKYGKILTGGLYGQISTDLIGVKLRTVKLIKNASERNPEMASQADPVMPFVLGKSQESQVEIIDSIAHPSDANPPGKPFIINSSILNLTPMGKSQPTYTKEFKQQAVQLFETSKKSKTPSCYMTCVDGGKSWSGYFSESPISNNSQALVTSYSGYQKD